MHRKSRPAYSSAVMHDILEYSGIGNAPQQRTVIALEEPLGVALANLEHHITHSGAAVTAGALPKVLADRTQMVMVFQNLVGNAIKYRGGEPPVIRIEAVQRGSEWVVSVTDNGQGFQPEYAAAIFAPSNVCMAERCREAALVWRRASASLSGQGGASGENPSPAAARPSSSRSRRSQLYS